MRGITQAWLVLTLVSPGVPAQAATPGVSPQTWEQHGPDVRNVQNDVQQPPRGTSQNPRGRGQGGLPAPGAGVPVQQLQTMFDAYALLQAQRILELSDEQYQQFFLRMNRLHELRRQHMQQRNRLINELRRMYGRQGAGDSALAEGTRKLDEMEERFAQDLRTTRAAIDEVLTVRQRAAFRFFEEEMERQKIAFITRARQRPGL